MINYWFCLNWTLNRFCSSTVIVFCHFCSFYGCGYGNYKTLTTWNWKLIGTLCTAPDSMINVTFIADVMDCVPCVANSESIVGIYRHKEHNSIVNLSFRIPFDSLWYLLHSWDKNYLEKYLDFKTINTNKMHHSVFSKYNKCIPTYLWFVYVKRSLSAKRMVLLRLELGQSGQ